MTRIRSMSWFVCGALALTCLAGKCYADKEDDLFELVSKTYDNGDHDRTIDVCTKALKPRLNNSTRFLYVRGLAWLAKNENKIALGDFSAVIRAAPKFEDVYVSRAEAYVGLKEYDKAIDDCNEALRLDSKRARAWLVRGMSYQRKGDKKKAEADIGKALELDPHIAKPVK